MQSEFIIYYRFFIQSEFVIYYTFFTYSKYLSVSSLRIFHPEFITYYTFFTYFDILLSLLVIGTLLFRVLFS